LRISQASTATNTFRAARKTQHGFCSARSKAATSSTCFGVADFHADTTGQCYLHGQWIFVTRIFSRFHTASSHRTLSGNRAGIRRCRRQDNPALSSPLCAQVANVWY